METRLIRPERSSAFSLGRWEKVSILEQVGKSKVSVDDNAINEILHYHNWPREDRKETSVELLKSLRAVRIRCVVAHLKKTEYQSANLLDALLLIERKNPQRVCLSLVLPDLDWSNINFEDFEHTSMVRRYIFFEWYSGVRKWRLTTPKGCGVINSATGILCVKK